MRHRKPDWAPEGAQIVEVDYSWIDELLRRLDMFSEDDLGYLLSVEPGTLKAWRSRNKGPSYIVAGNVVLYRAEDVKAWLDSKVRERGIKPKDLL